MTAAAVVAETTEQPTSAQAIASALTDDMLNRPGGWSWELTIAQMLAEGEAFVREFGRPMPAGQRDDLTEHLTWWVSMAERNEAGR